MADEWDKRAADIVRKCKSWDGLENAPLYRQELATALRAADSAADSAAYNRGLRDAAEVARTAPFKDGCLVSQGRDTIVAAILAKEQDAARPTTTGEK